MHGGRAARNGLPEQHGDGHITASLCEVRSAGGGGVCEMTQAPERVRTEQCGRLWTVLEESIDLAQLT